MINNFILRNAHIVKLRAQIQLLRIYSATMTCTSTRSQQPLLLLSLIRLVEFENKYARQFGRWDNTNKTQQRSQKQYNTHFIFWQPCKSTKLPCFISYALVSCFYLLFLQWTSEVVSLGGSWCRFFSRFTYKISVSCVNCLLKCTYDIWENVKKISRIFQMSAGLITIRCDKRVDISCCLYIRGCYFILLFHVFLSVSL